MPYIRKYLPDKDLVYLKGFEEIKYEHSLKIVEYLSNLGCTNEVKDVLIDHTQVEAIPNTVEVFNLGSVAGHKFKQLNFAIIHPEVFDDSYALFETTGNKRGANIKVFSDKETALNWLIDLRECVWT